MTQEQPEPTPELMLEYEYKAETAYSSMYDCEPWNEKDFKDDALFFLARAIEVAGALRLEEDAARLRARVDNIMGVYIQMTPSRPPKRISGAKRDETRSSSTYG